MRVHPFLSLPTWKTFNQFLLSCSSLFPFLPFPSPFASYSTVIMHPRAEGTAFIVSRHYSPVDTRCALFSPCLNFVACWANNGRNRGGLRVSNFLNVRAHIFDASFASSPRIPLTPSEIDGFRSSSLLTSFFSFFPYSQYTRVLQLNSSRSL